VLPLPGPLIVALYCVTNAGFEGLKFSSLNWISNGDEAHADAPPIHVADSELMSSPNGMSEGEKLVPLVTVMSQPLIVPAAVVVPAEILESPRIPVVFVRL
jgi:hypothetical protein